MLVFYLSYNLVSVWNIFQKLAGDNIAVNISDFSKLVLFTILNLDGLFFLLWFGLIISMLVNWVSSPIYRIINLAIISLLMVFLWGYSLDFTFILLCYIIAFTSAVVMLFLSVVLMLPASTVVDYKLVQNYFGLSYLFLSSQCLEGGKNGLLDLINTVLFEGLIDFLILLIFLDGVFLLFGHLNKYPVVLENNVEEKNYSNAYTIFYKNSSFLTTHHSWMGWSFFKVQDKLPELLLHFKQYEKIPTYFLKNLNANAAFGNFIQRIGNPFINLHSVLSTDSSAVGREMLKFYFIQPKIGVAETVASFVFEAIGLCVTLIDAVVTDEKRHKVVLWLLKVVKTWAEQYPVIFNVVVLVEKYYLIMHCAWENEKFMYPNRFNNWELPIIYVNQLNCFIIRMLPWWSPFQTVAIIKMGLEQIQKCIINFQIIKDNITLYLEALVQSICIILFFVFLVPVSYNFEKLFTIFSESRFEKTTKVVNYDSLVELKHLIYEDMPLFIIVSVLLLLIALLSVSILKKK